MIALLGVLASIVILTVIGSVAVRSENRAKHRP